MAKQFTSDFLVSNRPSSFSANPWLDASICGNGNIGAAVLGAYSNERILFNHSSLRSGGHTGVLQDVSDKFPNIRKHLTNVKVYDAERVLPGEFEKRNYKPAPHVSHPLGVLNLNFFQEGQITDYKRVTDMTSGEVSVAFTAGGTTFERNMFVSRRDDVIVYNVKRIGTQRVNCTISFDDLHATKTATDKKIANKSQTNNNMTYVNGFVIFSSKTSAGVEYGLASRVMLNTPSGKIEQNENGIKIIDADGFLIFSKIFVGGNKDTELKKLQNELNGIKLTYDKLQQQNEGMHKRLYEAVSLNLDGTDSNIDTSSLIDKTRVGQLPSALVSRMWNFAKYIALCGYGDFVTPNGVWCGEIGCETDILSFDSVAQLIYLGMAGSVNSDAILSLFDYFEKYAQDLKKNAARVYGAEGYFVPNMVSPDSALFGRVDSATLHFIASSALAANLFYSYFLSTGDTKVLKSKIFPFMKEVYNFYSDFLKLDQSGFYSTVPSYSPHSTPGNTIGGKKLENFHFATNSTIDFLAVDALLDNLIHASTILNAGEEAVWQEMKKKIPPMQVGGEGAIKEYTNSPFIDRIQNCGLMHTYGLWPLKNLSFNDKIVSYKPTVAVGGNSEISLKRASANAVLERLTKAGTYQSANTLALGAIQLAHSGDMSNTQNILMKLASSCFSDSGLCLNNDWRGSGFTQNTRPSLDLGGNMGFATAITECVVQSDKSNLRILPCVFEGLECGTIKGIATDFCASIDMDWDLNKGKLTLKINPKMNCEINIFINEKFKKLKSKDLTLDKENCLRSIKLIAGKTTTIEF